MFGLSRRRAAHNLEVPSALLEAASALRELARSMSERSQKGDGALASIETRVGALETSVAKTLAEAQALVIKAESLKGAARAAEERARYAARTAVGKSVEDGPPGELTDEQIAEAYAAAGIHQDDAGAEPSSRLSTVQQRLAGRREIIRDLTARKFG